MNSNMTLPPARSGAFRIPELLKKYWMTATIFFAAMAGTHVAAQIPHFLTPVNYAAPGASMATLADVNGDGILDIVTANGFTFKGAGVSLLLGKKNGTFQPAKTIVAAGAPSWVLVGDFNN